MWHHEHDSFLLALAIEAAAKREPRTAFFDLGAVLSDDRHRALIVRLLKADAGWVDPNTLSETA